MTARSAKTEQHAVESAYRLFGPLRLRNCPLTPTPRQEAFLLLDAFEVFFGGAAAGGKSAALLMAALQYSDVPGYHALLVRTSLTSLPARKPIDLSHEGLTGTQAALAGRPAPVALPRPRTQRCRRRDTAGSVTSPTKATSPRYAGSSYTYLGFDELTRFEELLLPADAASAPPANRAQPGAPAETAPGSTTYQYASVATSNPGGRHHEWVRTRFVDQDSRTIGAVFLPSRLEDNAHIDQAAYIETLSHLPTCRTGTATARQLETPTTANSSNANGSPSSNEASCPTEDAPSVLGPRRQRPGCQQTATPTTPRPPP